ncbi:ATPase, T2SS/T4P/T4SS family [Paenibacillus sp. NPDC056579]|uniref:ATPase, T2SS/T4P/T4SS family n=1 Tax=Paenibacillus sp. NPDC056579 TaxID=3345871 RepID=UPI00369A24A6
MAVAALELHYKEFALDTFLEGILKETDVQQVVSESNVNKMERFFELCRAVQIHFNQEWKETEGHKVEESDKLLLYQKKAIIGYTQEVNYFKGKISDFLKRNNLMHEWKPHWYSDLVTAIFQENWGFCGVDEWKNNPESSSCKIIGERIYFLIDGKQVLQEQTISKDRLQQLITALLLPTPEKRMEDNHEEVYMLDGTRIKIFADGLAKETSIVFRKYVVKQFTFEAQAKRKTIPNEMTTMLKAMVDIGFNVNFIGAVRSGKTTFLTTWQSYEDDSLEGIQIETDPEIPLHVIMPKAPIIQLVADGDELKSIMKEIMRADGDYLIMAEARDGVALKIGVQSANKGTRRVKSTFHSSSAADFCYDAATEIVQEFGGDVWAYTVKVAKSYHYLFEFTQLKKKDQKRLKGIHEIRFNPSTLQITTHQICKYDPLRDNWTFKYDIGEDKIEIGQFENVEALERFQRELRKLSDSFPMEGEHVTEMPYFKFLNRG